MRRPSKLAAALAAVVSASMLAATGPASADIFQWQYINPTDPAQGKQPSTTLCLGGAGVNAVPSADLNSRNLTMAYLIGADLTNARFNSSTLTNADFSHANLTNAFFAQAYSFVPVATLTSANFDHANLTNADLGSATLTSANLTDAQVRGASFYNTTSSGFTAAQLYSTASYQDHDLTGINFSANNLSGWSFAGQNLTNAKLGGGDLTSANFTGAEVRAASLSGLGFTAAQLYSTASYQNHDLTGINLGGNLSGWSLAGQNLTNASFSQATLSSANFTGAEVRGACFDAATGFTAAQLFSTASYQSHDLTGISFQQNDLSGWSFAGQNLTNAKLAGATLNNVNFTAAEVRGADFHQGAGFTAAQLYSTASYQNHDLSGIHLVNTNLSGWNFAGQNLANTDFYYSTLTSAKFNHANLTNANLVSAALADADFTGAEVRGAYLPGLTAAQLYSTASYQNHDLSGIAFYGYEVSGLNFAGQNLTKAGFFDATLTSADFSHTNLTNAGISYLADDDIIPFGDNLYLANFSYAIPAQGHIAAIGLLYKHIVFGDADDLLKRFGGFDHPNRFPMSQSSLISLGGGGVDFRTRLPIRYKHVKTHTGSQGCLARFAADFTVGGANLLEQIGERNATILRLRYGLKGGDPMTLKEIGKEIGLTRERVRQIACDALAKLRKAMALNS